MTFRVAPPPLLVKTLVTVLLVLLSAAGLALHFTQADVKSSIPVLYLSTSPGPETDSILSAFQSWLRESDGNAVDVQVDASDRRKVIIQGISGIGPDLMPANLGADLRYLKAMGLTLDLTDRAKQGAFSPNAFGEVVADEVMVDRKQFACPTLLYVLMNYANLDTFAQLGLPPPPSRMSFDEFEAMGREFVARANPPGQKQRRFFCSSVSMLTLHRSLGLDVFNETLTQCTLDDPRAAETLERIHRWTDQDHLLPSATDLASFSSDGSTAAAFGPRLYQFAHGNIGIIAGGSYLTSNLRKLGAMRLSVLEAPNRGFPNAVMGASMLSIYSGSKHPDAATQYLKFLASEAYAHEVIRTGLGIPARLTLARNSPEFLRPPAFPNEWGCNERFLNAIEEIGIPYSASPFVLHSVYSRILEKAQGTYMAGRSTAREAVRRANEEINAEIERTLHEQPELRTEFDQLMELQREIDKRRSQGTAIPKEWVSNPFHRKYYQKMGWLQ